MEVICNVHSTIKECLRKFIICAAKLFPNVKLDLTCSNYGVVGPLTFDVYSIKLEMSYSATSIKEDWTLGGFQSNTHSTEVVNLFC